MIRRWTHYRRKWLRFADDLEEFGDDDAELFRNMAGDIQRRIEHVKAGKPPPLPDAPACEFFLRTAEFHENLKLLDWNMRQARLMRAEACSDPNAKGD